MCLIISVADSVRVQVSVTPVIQVSLVFLLYATCKNVQSNFPHLS